MNIGITMVMDNTTTAYRKTYVQNILKVVFHMQKRTQEYDIYHKDNTNIMKYSDQNKTQHILLCNHMKTKRKVSPSNSPENLKALPRSLKETKIIQTI